MPECDGGCEEHVGEVRRVYVDGWGEFDYCEMAIAEDQRRGLRVFVLEPDGEPGPGIESLELALRERRE